MNKAIKIFILLLLTLSLGAITMTITIPATVTPSSQFHGRYDVLTYVNDRGVEGVYQAYRQERIPCHNLASARAVRDRLNGVTKQTNVSLPLSVERSLLTPEQLGGCRTGGLGYDPAVTWALTGRVERVHNWGTAKSLASDYPV